MTGEDINKNFIEMVFRDKDSYEKDYHLTAERVKNSSAIYKGKPVPFTYNPMFYSTSEEIEIKKIMEYMMQICDKVTDEYIKNPEFRKRFLFPKEIEELILLENPYDVNIPIARFDMFYKDKDNFKFCELNTDGSSAMNEDNTIARILLESKALKDFKEGFELYNRELIEKWVEVSLELYEKAKFREGNPNVAIVDFKESATTYEFLEFKKAYEKKGLKTLIVDPRDLVYKDNKLYYENTRIDLIYRRIVTFELIEKFNEAEEFIKAYRDGNVVTIGSLRSQVVHNKIFFKVLHDIDIKFLLNDDELEFVKKHIPYTNIFGGDEDVFKEVLRNKDNYVIKPMDMNASQGVSIGRDMEELSWKRNLEKTFNKNYIYQEFVSPYEREFLVYEGGLKRKILKYLVGVFLYNRKYAGMYTRVSENNLISGVKDYYTAANIIAKKQGE
ncbi:MAG: glutathionylspermidine synthase family protein [Tissierellales bacterium]|nr:glutathionylspermidine synthase family protein [Tissierellales bacterium]